MSTNTEIQKFSHHEHILKISDTYIGSTEKTTEDMWIYDENEKKMVKNILTFIPGEYKIFDEIVVNAVDHATRTYEKFKKNKNIETVKNIKITIEDVTGRITVFNDGEGIPIEIHSKEGVYTPELIFGHLLTSSNYDVDKKIKHVGGKNGYGAKLTNIFSTEFTIETVCSKSGKKYSQTFENNMYKKSKPKITVNKGKPYTKISFIPDHKRFKCDKLGSDLILLMKKRVYDIAACTSSSINVWLNGSKIETKSFEKYMDLFIGSKSETKRAFEIVNDRWQVGAALNPNLTFEHISMVNGINTTHGGKHVDYVINNITKKLSEYIKKKKKIDIKPSYIKDNIIVFINSKIDDPSFNSQIKECLTTNMSKFGSKCELSDKFIDTLAKSGILEKAIELKSAKENKDLKKTDGKKKNRITGIPKLDDANWAGTRKSKDTTLILTEGDSAKAMAIAGLGVVGRDKFGVFPLRGKLLNVKGNEISMVKKILNNAEISNLKKIIGLEAGREYKNVDDLRYGRVCILTDQDEDGSHIKGLVFNLFETLWPSLFRQKGFLTTILTPVIKASKKKKVHEFYCISDYEKWKSKNDNGKGWTIKYYKGLGTSTAKEAREYFNKFKLVTYTADNKEDIESIHLAFGQENNSADLRKDWLKKHDQNVTLDYNSSHVSIREFVYYDLSHFSNSDNKRSLPNVIDGFKTSQRKVFYAAIKRNLTKEIRVAQFAGYVSEHAAYHHGEASLQGTIVKMAQDHIGSNNINLLQPNGQFGTRLKGGEDAAQPRYIHTCLSSYSTKIFDQLDNPILKYLDDDGMLVEPEFYVPVLPMILINGCQGIGTGWSSKIPCFNPKDIINNIKRLLKKEELVEMNPWYKNFKGQIIKDENGFITKGVYSINKRTVTITELPIGCWTEKYKEFLESIMIENSTKDNKNKLIKYYKTYCTDTEVNFEIEFIDDRLKKLTSDKSFPINKFEKIMKLTSSLSTTNMVLHDIDNNLVKFESPLDIIKYHFNVRLDYYNRRKEHLIKNFKKDISILEIKVRFIMDFINDKIKISKKKKVEIINQLINLEYPNINDIDKKFNDPSGYDFLLKMPIYNLTEEKIEEFNKNLCKIKSDYDSLKVKTLDDLWTNDIDNLNIEVSPKKLILKKKKK